MIGATTIQGVRDTNRNNVIDGGDEVVLSDGVKSSRALVSRYIGEGSPAEKLAKLAAVVKASRENPTSVKRPPVRVSGQLVCQSLAPDYSTYTGVEVSGHNGLIETSTVVGNGGFSTTVGEYVRGNPDRLYSVLMAAGKTGGADILVSPDVIEAAVQAVGGQKEVKPPPK